MKIELIPVQESQLDEVADMARIIWNDHYPAIVGQAQVDYMLDKIYSHESMLNQVRTQGHKFYFVRVDGKTEGFISVKYNDADNELFLNKFYLYSQKQKSGIGTIAFQTLMNHFPNTKFVRLTVNRQNYKSVNFYFKNGFIIEKVADFDIGNNYYMNDFIMLKKL